jgi:hypothetical protein
MLVLTAPAGILSVRPTLSVEPGSEGSRLHRRVGVYGVGVGVDPDVGGSVGYGVVVGLGVEVVFMGFVVFLAVAGRSLVPCNVKMSPAIVAVMEPFAPPAATVTCVAK